MRRGEGAILSLDFAPTQDLIRETEADLP